MIISSSKIELQSSHLAFSHTETSERLEVWVGNRPANGGEQAATRLTGPGALVALSQEAMEASKADAVASNEDAQEADPRLQMLRNLIEYLTGKPMRVFRMSELADPNQVASATPSPGDGGRAAGFGFAYDFSSVRSEYEQVSFQAQGSIRTADGREIRFEVGFEMSRSFAERIDISLRGGDARLTDPLVLDFGGPAGALSDLRFEFDLDADGTPDAIPMLAGGTGYLAIDRNDNGRIDDGRELFGPTSGNGFAELAALDSDGNGWIDEADPAYAQLRIWRPDANGGGTLTTLADAGVGALYLGNVATPFELRGANNGTLGVMRASGIYLRENGSVGTISQIDLSV
ncbi:MAG: hypothetical protein ACK4KV_02755 [Rhodocyclaceae bacterium]